MSPRLKSLLVLGFVFTLSLFAVLVFRNHVQEIDHLLVQIGLIGPLVVIGLYTILSLTPIPTDPLTVMMGAFYGPFLGLLISWIGNTSAALLEYFVAHHIRHATNFDTLRRKLPWGLARAPVDSIWFLTLGRIVPGFGSKVVSVMAGLYHVPKWRYLWTSALMNLVGALGYVLAGHLLTRL
jgi:uncharacterized membrane protein YdjX (TVP38/TMEM64 family)